MECKNCGHKNPKSAAFCNRCGQAFPPSKTPEKRTVNSTGAASLHPQDVVQPLGERKYTTVLFSDLSGYTTITESLDPEEVHEVMSRIFQEADKIISKHGGTVEKFVGDAVMAIFGVPFVHEDDSIRAIRTSIEIHEFVKKLSPKVEKRLGRGISMHTGINTGLVVTGGSHFASGKIGVVGDAVNVASRLSDLAKPGEILVGAETRSLSEQSFKFEELTATRVKGKANPVKVFRLLAYRKKPLPRHRSIGTRSKLIGRKVEMAQLEEAIDRLREGEGSVIGICGEAGNGKSRLIEEFKNSLPEDIRWLEGFSTEHSRNIPYSPLVSLLSHAWKIEENDEPDQVRNKIDAQTKRLLGQDSDSAPFLANLFSIDHPELENVSPELLKKRLQQAILDTYEALVSEKLSVIFIEDFHWADPSTMALIREMVGKVHSPSILLTTFRPTDIFDFSQWPVQSGVVKKEIRLRELSKSQTIDLLNALLNGTAPSSTLQNAILEKSGGNPFYVEELINALTESGSIIESGGQWGFANQSTALNVPHTIQGVLMARLDRLGDVNKQIIQEASAIGRKFPVVILNRITETTGGIEDALNELERLDFIRASNPESKSEYIFKHPMTHDVIYKSMLIRVRQSIHERIGRVMEQSFRKRLPDFYENLAYHFRRSRAFYKAIKYLGKSGEKSLGRYTLEEANRYFQQAHDLLLSRKNLTLKDKKILVDLINQWAPVFYFSGHHKEMRDLLTAKIPLVESLEDHSRKGFFYVWLATSLRILGQYRESYDYTIKALILGEELKDPSVIVYACSALSWSCAELGRLDEGEKWGKRAWDMLGDFEDDQFLQTLAMSGLGYVVYYKGDAGRLLEITRALMDYGNKHGSVYAQVLGYLFTGAIRLIQGRYSEAIEEASEALILSGDQFYSIAAKNWLGFAYVLNEEAEKAEPLLVEAIEFCEKHGLEYARPIAVGAMGTVLLRKGEMAEGLELLIQVARDCREKNRQVIEAQFEYIQGKVFLQMALGHSRPSLLVILKNLKFLAKHLPKAGQLAKAHLEKSILIAHEVGANQLLATSYLDLGHLHRSRKNSEDARRCYIKAIKLFEQNSADNFILEAKSALGQVVGSSTAG